jgi:hypothetical protein
VASLAAAEAAAAEAVAAEAAAVESAVEEAACGAEGRGGWGRRQHELFEATYRGLQASAAGRSRARVLDRLALTLAGEEVEAEGSGPSSSSSSSGGGGGGGGGGGLYGRVELERHAAWSDAQHLRKQKRLEMAERYKRSQGECLAWARTRLEEARQAATDRQERLRLADASAQRALELRRRLALLQPGRDAANGEKAAEAERLRLAEAETAAALAALEGARAVKRRAAVEKFHGDQAEARKQRLKDEVEDQRRAEAARLSRLAANGKVVEFRSDQRSAKLESVEQLRWAAQVNLGGKERERERDGSGRQSSTHPCKGNHDPVALKTCRHSFSLLGGALLTRLPFVFI